MGLYNTFKTDSDIERDGVLLEYGTTDDGKPVSIRIARAGGGNTRFAKALEKKMRPYRRQLQAGTMDDEVAKNLMLGVYADTVVLGWDNVQDENGNDLPFNRDNVIKVLTDLPDLFADIQDMSTRISLFREEVREADAKN